jgi:hypothetical protein
MFLSRCQWSLSVPATYNSITELIAEGSSIIIYASHLLRAAYPTMLGVAESILTNARSVEADAALKPVLHTCCAKLMPGGSRGELTGGGRSGGEASAAGVGVSQARRAAGARGCAGRAAGAARRGRRRNQGQVGGQHGADWVGQLTHFAGHLSHSVGFRAYLEVPLGANESCE